jgi:hypothetical protein
MIVSVEWKKEVRDIVEFTNGVSMDYVYVAKFLSYVSYDR